MTKENYIWLYDGDCIVKIMYYDFSTSSDPFWILGLNFFHNYYTIYDMDSMRVGIANSIYSNLQLFEDDHLMPS